MVFSDITFLYGFLPVVLLVYFALPAVYKNNLKNLLILISSLIFYSWGEPFYVIIMIISTLFDYFVGLILWRFDDNKLVRRAALIISVVMNLSLLGLFKYSGFVVENINAVFGAEIMNPNLALPIGISFYTFQSMSYTIDLYMRNIKVQKNPISFAAFVTMFPQVVAGPIVRYNDVAAELENRTVTTDKIYEGINHFIVGLGKKVLIANNIGMMWSEVKTMNIASMSMFTSWLGILAFTFQIYFDFSGYSDMAVGLGKIMGFNFPKNFDYPYMSKSISEFWRRWHITLGSWFKHYVYFPLGGSKKGISRTVLNLAIVWLLTGIWHGASWNFILWGCLYGVVIIIEKLFLGKLLDKLPSLLRIMYTMLLVIIGWVLFDTNDLPGALSYISTMFGGSGIILDSMAYYLFLNYGIMLVICFFACTDSWKRIWAAVSEKIGIKAGYVVIVSDVFIFLLSTAYLVDATYNPFLYFNF